MKVDPLSKKCTRCGAKPGVACSSVGEDSYCRGAPLKRCHPERYEAARQGATSFRAAAHAWFDRRTRPRGPGTMECVHCSDDVTILLKLFDGEIDHWLLDGQEIACSTCGGINRAMVDAESEPYFAACEDEVCAACDGEKGATRG